jgi:hypothetical protein
MTHPEAGTLNRILLAAVEQTIVVCRLLSDREKVGQPRQSPETSPSRSSSYA